MKIMNAYVKFIQKALVNVFLLLLYFFGFGLTRIIVCVFERKLIKKRRGWTPSLKDELSDFVRGA